MASLLDDIAVLHHEDAVRIPNRGEAVRYDKAGPAPHQVIHRLLDPHLGPGVDRTGRLVEDQDFGIGQDGSRNGQQLLLSLGDIARFLVEFHVVAVRQRLDEVVHMRGLGSGDDLLVGRVEAAVPDVLPDGAVEQPGILQHHAEHLPELAAVEIADIVSVHQDSTRIDIVEPHKQLDHGGLAGAGRADNGDFLPGLHVGSKIVDDDFIRVVAEADMLEIHLTLQAVDRDRMLHRDILFGLLEEFEHPLAGRRCGLEQIGHLRHLRERLGEHADILHEGHDGLHADPAPDDQPASQHRHHDISEVADELHHRLHHPRQELGFPGGFVQRLIGFVEAADRLFLMIEGLDDTMPAVHLFHLSVDMSQIFLLGFEVFLGMLDDEADAEHRNRQDAQRRQGQLPADGQHHHQYADHLGDGGDELGNALVEALAQGIHVVGDAGEHLAVGLGIVVFHGQTVDLLGDLPPQVVGHLLGHAGHQNTLNDRQSGTEQIHAQQDEQDFAHVHKVDAAARHPRHHLHHTVDDGAVGLHQHLRAVDVQEHSAHGEDQHQDDRHFIAGDILDELAHGAAEVLGLFAAEMSGAVAHAARTHCGTFSVTHYANSSFDS